MVYKTFSVEIKANSKKEEIIIEKGNIFARVKEPPIDGKANERLIELISEFFNCPKSKIFIKSGQKSKKKLIVIKE